jgi:hypothetical protein
VDELSDMTMITFSLPKSILLILPKLPVFGGCHLCFSFSPFGSDGVAVAAERGKEGVLRGPLVARNVTIHWASRASQWH